MSKMNVNGTYDDENGIAKIMVSAYKWGNMPIPIEHKMIHILRAMRSSGYVVEKSIMII